MARVVMQWPIGAAVAPAPAPMLAATDTGRSQRAPVDRSEKPSWPIVDERRLSAVPSRSAPLARMPTVPSVALALTAMVRYGDEEPAAFPIGGAIPPPLRPTPLAGGRSRLAGSAWLIARGGGNGTLTGGQLGASQAGARLTYALGEARRVALSARFASPLRGQGKEAALGIDWQPTRMPLHLVVEQRVSLDGGRGGPTLMLVGGVNPTPVLAGFRLEAYAQAGAIRRDVVEAFGDGAARLTRRAARLGQTTIDLGAGAWGAAQRGTQRLDIGPTIGAVLPVEDRALRVTLDCGIMYQMHQA